MIAVSFNKYVVSPPVVRIGGVLKRILAILCVVFGAFVADAQVAVKSNLLYDAMTTPNLGVEVGIAPKQTVNLVYGLNAWSFTRNGQDSKAKHWVVQPEWRWWTCSRFNGHFIGAHLMGGEFNAANVALPIPGFFFAGDNLTKMVRDYRAQGAFAGLGVTYGYQFILSKHWNLEAEIGAGYNHVWYSEYACGQCGGKLQTAGTNYLGITKIGLSILYLF